MSEGADGDPWLFSCGSDGDSSALRLALTLFEYCLMQRALSPSALSLKRSLLLSSLLNSSSDSVEAVRFREALELAICEGASPQEALVAFRSLAFLTGGSEMIMLESLGGEPWLDDLAGIFHPSTELDSFFLVRGIAVFSHECPVLGDFLMSAGAVLDGRASPSSSSFLILG